MVVWTGDSWGVMCCGGLPVIWWCSICFHTPARGSGLSWSGLTHRVINISWSNVEGDIWEPWQTCWSLSVITRHHGRCRWGCQGFATSQKNDNNTKENNTVEYLYPNCVVAHISFFETDVTPLVPHPIRVWIGVKDCGWRLSGCFIL